MELRTRLNLAAMEDGAAVISADGDRPARLAEVDIRTISDLGAFLTLAEAEWDGLVLALPHPTPYLLHGWLTAWFRNGAGGARPLVQIALREGRLVGALALEVVRLHGLRIGRFPGGSVAAWRDLMLAPGEPLETARELLNRMQVGGPDFIYLQCLAPDSRLAALTRMPLVDRFENASVDLTAGWEAAYRRRVGKRHRQDFRHKRQLLSRLGDLRVAVARQPTEFRRVLEHTFRLHELRWRGRYDGIGYSSAQSRLTTNDAVAALAARSNYRIVTLELDGNPIAFLSYFVIGRTAVGHQTAFDPSYSRYSPGVLVFFEAFALCEQEGLQRFEFGGGDDRYKRSLADAIEPLTDGVGMALGLRGVLGASVWLICLRLGRRIRTSPRLRSTVRRARDLLCSS